jgi:hypothetical protein
MLEDYYIERISYTQAMEIAVAKHYLHRKSNCSLAFGLFHKNSLDCLGIIVYGNSPSVSLLQSICGPDEAKNVYELTRLWVDDSVPKNGESFLIGRTLRMLDKEIVVSFADSSFNHVGLVYQATNWIYTGLSHKLRVPKIVGMEDKHHSSFARGLNRAGLIEKYGEENVYYVNSPRKHRYIYIAASKKRKRELLSKLRYESLPYPKAGVSNG